MHGITFQTRRTLALIFAATVAASPVFADPPSWGDGNRDGARDHGDRREGRRDHQQGRDLRSPRDREEGMRENRQFGDRHRTVIHDYYVEHYQAGLCPPGLAKKHNGCMPPGQARKWRIGRPLPRGVVYYDLPPALVVQLGPPPTGYRYVRVAGDILLIAVGTGMVLDALQDIYGQ